MWLQIVSYMLKKLKEIEMLYLSRLLKRQYWWVKTFTDSQLDIINQSTIKSAHY